MVLRFRGAAGHPPQLADMLGFKVPQPLGLIVMVVLVLALAGGFFAGVFLGSGVYARAHARVRDALDWLAANPGSHDTEERRRNAVSLIINTMVWDGPMVSTSIPPEEARERLGAAFRTS